MNERNKTRLNELVQMLSMGIVTKQDIICAFGVDERTAREMLSEIAKSCPLISISDTKGYRIAMSANDVDDAMHAYKENAKRAAEILKRNNPLVTFIRKHGEMI